MARDKYGLPGIYNATPITLQDGRGSALATDDSGKLLLGGTLPLPTGAATAANQTTEIASLSTIATNTGRIPSQGSATSSASLPVVIASDQAAVAVKGSATASAVPATAFYIGINGGAGNLTGIVAAGQQTDGVTGNNALSAGTMIYNGSTWDRNRSAINGTNSTGTGIVAAGIIAQYDDISPTSITENQFGNVRMSADRSILTTTQNLYSHISTSTTTTVKSGAGTLHIISVNSKGTVASTTTVYDNTAGSGTVIGVLDTLNLSGAFRYDIQFTTGLTLVTTGTVAPDITVSYK
jgi:hypothetical protein